MTENAISQNIFNEIYSIHSLLDIILAGIPKVSIASMQLIADLLKQNQTNIYIPGKTQSSEKNRIKIIRYGFVPILIHASLNGKSEKFRRTAENIVRYNCYLKELEWSLTMLMRYIAVNPSINKKCTLPAIAQKKSNTALEIVPELSSKTKASIHNSDSPYSSNTSKQNFPSAKFMNYLVMEYSNQQRNHNKKMEFYDEISYVLSEYFYYINRKSRELNFLEVRARLISLIGSIKVSHKNKELMKDKHGGEKKLFKKDKDQVFPLNDYGTKSSIMEYLKFPAMNEGSSSTRVKSFPKFDQSPSKTQKILG